MSERCPKLAPFICPRCLKPDCGVDHWDCHNGGPCAECGEWGCLKTSEEHRTRCVLPAGHEPPCAEAS